MEDCYLVVIDGKAYWVYYDTDILTPIEYEYC